MAEFPLVAPCALSRVHQVADFDCGKAPLNDFLRLYALANSQSGNSRTFVVADAEGKVAGYYTIAATSIQHDAAPQRVKQGQPRYPIPAILMARFAISLSAQAQGLGRTLFQDALLRCLNITDELGARAFVVDAKDEDALRFYGKFNMMPDPDDPHRLYLLFKDIKKILAR